MNEIAVWEIAILILSILIAWSIIWHTLRYGISPMPTSKTVRKKLFSMLPELDDGAIYELGSGFGTLAVPLAIHYPHLKVIGFEVSPVPYWIATLRARLLGIDNLEFRRHDFFTLDFGQAAMMVSYLYPGGMERLSQTLAKTDQPPKFLLSHTFALPGHEPLRTAQAADVYRSPIYLYELPATGSSASGEIKISV